MLISTRAVSSRPEAQTPLLEADEALVSDHEVVQHLDVEQLARGHDLARDRHILGRGRGIAARMVVHDHQSGTVVLDRLAEQLTYADDARVERALVDNGRGDHV